MRADAHNRQPHSLCAAACVDSSVLRARNVSSYDEALSEAIVLLKYEEITRLGDWFAAHLAEIALAASEDWPVYLVVPVPLHVDRRRERSYKQAERIACPLAKRLNLKFASDT